MDLLSEIFEFVSGGGHGSGGGTGYGGGSGSGSGSAGPVIVSDMGINEIGAEYYGNDQIPSGYRSFDIHRDISSNLDAFTIRQSAASPDILSSPTPTFYSRPLVVTDRQQGNVVQSFHLYSDSSLSHIPNNRLSAIPTPDLVSHVHFEKKKEHTTLSMNTMIAQANLFSSRMLASKPPQPFSNPQQQAKGSMIILKEGWKRKYRVDVARYRDDGRGPPMTHVFYWKGPTSSRASILGSYNIHNNNKSKPGSELKLVSATHPTHILAVWKSGDGPAMGNLTIFERIGFFEEGILTEIIASCLAVTIFERNSSSGLLDWLTK
ncbi:hypothetical protein PISL3812_03829 [Talaromyces islandicus]|uniref:Uncharacterized protein n=1 Tax=Talaromyces islandicus TaxID=28573 RepID=A0A0U1LTS9_TALIS|nr:hypothetical protein PISL3812_03829 [Talaromyces islandicus]